MDETQIEKIRLHTHKTNHHHSQHWRSVDDGVAALVFPVLVAWLALPLACHHSSFADASSSQQEISSEVMHACSTHPSTLVLKAGVEAMTAFQHSFPSCLAPEVPCTPRFGFFPSPPYTNVYVTCMIPYQ